MDDDTNSIIDEYFKLYDICEIKLDLEDLESNYFEPFVDYCDKYYKDRLSFHLSSRLFDELSSFTDYLKLLNSKSHNYNGYFIVHIPNTKKIISYDDIENSILQRHLYQKFLFENDKNICVEEFCDFVKNNGVGTCFDFGHAHVNNEDFLSEINAFCDEVILESVREVHLHNVINGKDHQLFFDKMPNEVGHLMRKMPNCYRAIMEIKRINIFDEIAKEQYQDIKKIVH